MIFAEERKPTDNNPHCGLLFMKKEMAHSGLPEVAFERYAEVLVGQFHGTFFAIHK
jgi:hypothetical protein